MKYQDQSLLQLIRGVERRRFYVAVLKGLAGVLAVASLSIIALGWLSYRYRANAGVLVSLRLVALAAIVGAVYFFMVQACEGSQANLKLHVSLKSGIAVSTNVLSVRSR